VGARVNQALKPWCVLGYFNAIRSIEERKGVGSHMNYGLEISKFNFFIRQAGLLDIPMIDRKYTWYKPNGTCKSRIDKIMVLQDTLFFCVYLQDAFV